jgi:Patatin-like phospholipase
MTDDSQKPEKQELDPLDPENPPPIDRFCDVVLDGGVINGVVYPGFLVELARKFRFRSIGGTSVGAIAAALAAACEYNRRYGSDNGFNEGLAKMPGDLADWIDKPNEITRIRSLFQPHKTVRPIFEWFVDVLGSGLDRSNKKVDDEQSGPIGSLNYAQPKSPFAWIFVLWDAWKKAIRHVATFWFGLPLCALGALGMSGVLVMVGLFNPASFWPIVMFTEIVFLVAACFLYPLCALVRQAIVLMRMPGSGACTGMRADGSGAQGLSEWLYEGVQKSANLPLDKPLTFGNLWAAPGGPKAADGSAEPRSIDLRMITTCLSHGRIYELPLAEDDAVVMFKLSELKPFFPPEVIAHLRRVSKPLTFDTCAVLQRKYKERSIAFQQMSLPDPLLVARFKNLKNLIDNELQEAEDKPNGLLDPDIRELPTADLPIVVAARLSMSCPVLFQNVPLVGFNLDVEAEDIDFVRLWFSDGGIGSNFPIHLFDKPIPRWPTFGLKILDMPPRAISSGKPLTTYVPYAHRSGCDDNLLYPRDRGAFTALEVKPTVSSFLQFLFAIYTSAKDGHDQSFLRMPDVRNRVVCVYLNNRAGNMLNLKIAPGKIIELALEVGARGGENAASAYLATVRSPKYANWVNSWQDHRWVRLNMLTQGLRSYLRGFTQAVNASGLPQSTHCNTLRDQILEAVQSPPLRSRDVPTDEITLTRAQSDQLLEIVDNISALERQLRALDLPQPYVPDPMPVLRFKPQY